MGLIIDISAMEECINPYSFGEICVRCNGCGRFDKATQKECALAIYKQQLREQYEFDNWIEEFEEIQRENVKANIEYLEGKIKELEGLKC